MALVRKAGLKRHFDLGHVPFQQLASSGDADGFQIPVGRDALLLGERAQEMVLAQARDFAEPIQRYGLRVPFLKVGAYRADAGFVLFGLGQRFPGVVAQELAQKHGVALLRSNETTCTLMGSLISVLNLELAPRITRHGVLVEVYGEGILILGDSGIGKSELAIELVKRGHRLVADDAVELRKVSNRQIMGTAPENIRHFIELRGIGIVNVARVYGVGAVKLSESLDLVVQLEAWDPTKNYQRTGLENEYYDILGVSIPSTSIPVSPGRNLAVVLETAAINNRQKKMGYNAARELLIRLGLDDKMD